MVSPNLNTIYSFKGRTISVESPVYVYRNLTKKGVWYSIRQKGVVVAHSTSVCLRDCSFIVSETGRQRVIENQKKEVHAYVKGHLTDSIQFSGETVSISYNPYKYDSFVAPNLDYKSIEAASHIVCGEQGVKAMGTKFKDL